MRLWSMVSVALLATATPLCAQAGTAASDTPATADGPAAAFLREIYAVYDQAAAERYVNDAPGRLAIYRDVLARMDAAPATVRTDTQHTRMRLFYATAVVSTLGDAGDQAASRRETPPLVAQLRTALAASPNDVTLTEALARLLRVQGQHAQVDGNVADALPLFRETIGLNRALIAASSFQDRDYAERGLAIDLDNLANMEAQAGNRAEADQASQQALTLFRALAERSPASRPAQGSLLIALLRRAVNFGEAAQLDEAETQIRVMRGRGLLTERYAEIERMIPAVREQISRSRR
jgi:tetratricopeptide (TPR) repeat protein